MHGALPFKGWGRLMRCGYEHAMHVRALLAHPHGLTLQHTPTIFRGRRTEAYASDSPQSSDLLAPRASVVGRPADRTAARGHREPAIDEAGPGYIWSKIEGMKSLTQICPCSACTNLPHTGIFKIFHFGVEIFHVVERTSFPKLP